MHSEIIRHEVKDLESTDLVCLDSDIIKLENKHLSDRQSDKDRIAELEKYNADIHDKLTDRQLAVDTLYNIKLNNEKLITDMMEWFIKYGHTPECGLYFRSETCTCEHDGIIQRAKEAVKE